MDNLKEAQNWERRLGISQATLGALVLGSVIGGVASSLALGLVSGGVISGFGIRKVLGAKNIKKEQVQGILEGKAKKISEWERNSG